MNKSEEAKVLYSQLNSTFEGKTASTKLQQVYEKCNYLKD